MKGERHMKKHLSSIIVGIIFFCGLSLFLYPTVSNMYNEYLNKKLIGDYQESFSNIKPEEYKKAKEDALAYNKHINDPKKLEELGLAYEDMLNITGNGIMGYIEIPKISVSLVISHTLDEDILQRGIGHVEESALPIGGKSTHCVLAGHTGLPSAKLLTNIDHLNLGDMFYIHVLDEVLAYQVDDIAVVEPNEISKLKVVSGKDYLTLVTCTPYGVNSHRLLVRGVRVQGNGNYVSSGTSVQSDILFIDMKYLITISLIVIVVLIVIGRKIYMIRKNKKTKGGEK